MVGGALMLTAGRVAIALVAGQSVVADVRDGAVIGAAIGATWHWNARRAKAFRARFEPTEHVLTRPAASVGEDLRTRRYGNGGVAGIMTAGLSFAIVAGAALDEAPWAAAGFLAFALLCGATLVGALLTYTEVGVRGLRIRTPRRRLAVSWSELAEVRWDVVAGTYRLVLRTTDGREVTAAGIVIADTGDGRRRAARALAHIEAAWGRSA
jgi:hypothetical protein